MEKEKCVMCGVETVYNVSTNIDMRAGYIEGIGQLCLKCYNNDGINDDEVICIPKKMVLDNPNDSVLGSKIRRIFIAKE